MSPLPKKRLCWNCEGNVSEELETCSYCGVYVQNHFLNNSDPSWNLSYESAETASIAVPPPPYQIKLEIDNKKELPFNETVSSDANQEEEVESFYPTLFEQLKKDLFPTLFLMAGSIFFLFGVVLFLFSHNGTLTLQWETRDAIYFLGASLPLTLLGWKFLQDVD